MLSILPDEELVLMARKHWFVFALETIGIIGATIVALLIVGFGEAVISEKMIDTFGADRLIAIDVIVFAGILLFSLMTLAVIFTNYYLDVIILTNKRVVDCDQKTLFFRDVATIPIKNIVDIKAETRGIIQTFFNYGSLFVQTAGKTEEVIIRGIADPFEVKDAIIQTYQKYSPGMTGPESFSGKGSPIDKNLSRQQ